MKNYQNIYINVLCLYQNFFIETWDVNYFLFYYKNKEFKNDDSLGKMMEYFINKKEIKYCNNIHETWLFPFMQYSFKLKNSIIKFINI